MAGVPFDFQLPPSENLVAPEPVLEPHEHDVLCGRGGLTNHHPGNAWYRRLVRSNRPLYRTSPKHTKLLVAKAIVHHVQKQEPSGRFLECQRQTMLWFPVSYKKAVDKTSQALRERDRDGEGIADTKGMTLKDAAAPPEVLAQTAMSTGKPKDNMKTNINQENTGGAILEPPGLQQSSSWFWRNHKRLKTEEEPLALPTAPLTERASSIFRFFSTSKLMGNDANGNDNQAASNQQPEMTQSNGSGSFNRFKDDPLMNPFNSVPSPPRTTAARNANPRAMNRGDIPVGMNLEPPWQGMTSLPQQQQQTSVAAATFGICQPQSGGLEALPLAGLGALDPLPLGDISKGKRSRDSFESSGTTNVPDTLGDPDAPSLTRLSTQVSDWLQSFWPLGDERGRQQSQQMQHQIQVQQQQQQMQQQQMQQQQMQYQQQNSNIGNSNDSKTMSQEEVQRQLLQMSTSLTLLQSQLQNSNNNNNTNTSSNNGGNSSINSNGNKANDSVSTDISNQVQMQMQQLQKMRDSIVSSAMDNNNNAPPVPPTALTASVSSTFLQLVASPSQLFSGISNLFSENGQKSRVTSQVGGLGGSGMMMGVSDGMMGSNTSMGMNEDAMVDMGMGANTSRMHPNAMGGMNGMSSVPMMEANNSTGLMPAPMTLGAVSIGNGSLNTGFRGEFGSTVATDQQQPNFGRRSSGRSLLDDDD